MRWGAGLTAAVVLAAISTYCLAAPRAKPETTSADHQHQYADDSSDLLLRFFSLRWLQLPQSWSPLNGLFSNAQDDSAEIIGNVFTLRPFEPQQTSWLPFSGIFKPPRDKSEIGSEARHVEEHHFLYFAGSDTWRFWAFSHAGIVWSPKGLDNEGLTVKVLANGGIFNYFSTTLNRTVVGREYAATIMPGWRFKNAAFEMTVFAGYDYQQFRYMPFDPAASPQGAHAGIRAGVEIWYEPDTNTMLAADGSFSSIGTGDHARVAYGWRILERFYLGPELQYYSAPTYDHMRYGVHLTASKNYEHEWAGAAGYAEDSDGRSGIYIRIGYVSRR